MVASPTAKLLLRFIAANAFSMYTIAVDGLTLSVVEVDGKSVVPYEVRGKRGIQMH